MTGGGGADGDGFPSAPKDDLVFDTSVAHQARLYNYLLGGKDHYAADRAYARSLTAINPAVPAMARANRDFLGRAVRFLAGEAGVSQFLDIGTGIPAPGGTHEVALSVRPDARIVYVDNDPVVLAHAHAFRTGHGPGATDYVDADVRDPEAILRRAAKTLDFGEPVGLLLLMILHAIPDGDDPYGAVATLVDALPSGSYLAVSHMTADQAGPEADERFREITRRESRHQYTNRSRAEVARFFEGLDLVEPGLVPHQDWRPDREDKEMAGIISLWAGVARKP
ncbi:MAG: SAM-dependent methyltransferase [Nocardiopsaceae bacterium]|nr:SAM-dependent methyltransferase [Nocardiopsaceae bacterium]